MPRPPRPILIHGWVAPFFSLEVRAPALTIGTWPGAWPVVDRHIGADLTASVVYDFAVPILDFNMVLVAERELREIIALAAQSVPAQCDLTL